MIKRKVVLFENKKRPVVFVKPVTNLDGEIIKDLAVTDDARFYNYSEIINWDYLDNLDNASLNIFLDKNNRKFVNINPIKNPGRSQVARIVLHSFDEPKHSEEFYNTHEVDHINPSIPLSDDLYNLRWVTREENMRNAAITGVMTKKYDISLIDNICELICQGLSNVEISEKLNVDRRLVYDIRSGNSHSCISEKYLDKGFVYNKAKPKRDKKEREKLGIQICEMLQSGKRCCEICEELGIESGLVASVLRGESFKNISCNYDFSNYVYNNYKKRK